MIFQAVRLRQAFGYSVHVSPFIRALEYFIGMMAGILFLKLFEMYEGRETKKQVPSFILMSVLEIVSVGGYMYAVLYRGAWMRGIFALLACIPIMVLAFDAGIVSKIMGSKPFLWFGVIQFEFYILHQSVINLTQKYVQPYVENIWLRAVIAFGLIGILAYFYKRYLSKPLSKGLENILAKAERIVSGQ